MRSKYYNLCEIQTFILSEVHGEERKLLLRQQMVLHCDREREPMERELGMLKTFMIGLSQSRIRVHIIYVLEGRIACWCAKYDTT